MSLTISHLKLSPLDSNSRIASSAETSLRTKGRSLATSSLTAASIFSRSAGVDGAARERARQVDRRPVEPREHGRLGEPLAYLGTDEVVDEGPLGRLLLRAIGKGEGHLVHGFLVALQI